MKLQEVKNAEDLKSYCLSQDKDSCRSCEVYINHLESKDEICPNSKTLVNVISFNRKQKLAKLLK